MTPNLVNGEAPKGQAASPTGGVVETLRHLRARSPQESLGVQSNRGLLKESFLAAAITGVVFAALTVGPYYANKFFPASAPSTPAAQSGVDPNPQNPSPAPSPAANTEAKKPAGEPGKTPKGKDIPDVLGESGVKKGSPKVNPLDKKDDDIFKELNPK
jgi:hypothetical protein